MEGCNVNPDDEFPIEELFKAYYDARSNKRNTSSQLRFELHLEENITALYHELCTRRYVIGTSICFVISDSVRREVFAADFRDRVVHHFLYNRLSPIFEKKFIHDSYSCRKGKGTLFGIRRLQHHIRSCSHNYSRDCYVLKLDLRGYFMNIDRRILYDRIEAALPSDMPGRDFVLWLTHEVVMYEPIVNCRVKGCLEDWADLPTEKSLFYAGDSKGMPIGNLTSQLFSNIYLNAFDQWMKRNIGFRHYGRYVDDFYVVHESKELLKKSIPLIAEFLECNSGLTLHPGKVVLQHYDKGVRFLGTVVFPYRIIPAERVRNKMKRAFLYVDSGAVSPAGMRSTLNSYLGIMRHLSSNKMVDACISACVEPYHYGYFVHSKRHYKYMLYII